jgi:FG-GAP-like repeat/FG-GAP repeat
MGGRISGLALALALVTAPAAPNGVPSFAAAKRYTTGTGRDSEPLSIAVGDLNGDHKPDLVTANGGDVVSVLMNRGGGSFRAKRDYLVGGGAFSVATADLNDDGHVDLAVADADAGAVSVLINRGDGTFGSRGDYATAPDPGSIAIEDLDGDGEPDVVTANTPEDNLDAATVSVLLNKGNGTFRARRDYPTGPYNKSVALADLNGDGKADIVTANHGGNGSVSVLLNKGDGTFEPRHDYRVGHSPYGTQVNSAAVGDMNADGKPDVVTADDRRTVSVLLNRGDGTFGPSRDYGLFKGGPNWLVAGPNAVALGDLNADGKLDVVTANVNAHASLLLNTGAGVVGALDYPACGFGHAAAIADLNGDRRQDLAVAGHHLCVLINKPGLCDVQAVRGLTVFAARRLLARAHCRVGRVRRDYSDLVRRGRVASQKPGFAVVLAGGGKVDLVVSRGRRR